MNPPPPTRMADRHSFLRLCLFFVVLLTGALTARCVEAPSPEPEWQAVLALDAGPKAAPVSPEEARTIALGFLEKKEAVLRDYLARNPQGSHVIDAQLRLASLLANRSNLTGSPVPFEAAMQILEAIAKTVPEARAADIAFARVALLMRRTKLPSAAERAALCDEMNAFQKRFPDDRRVAPLIAEVASLYDDQPAYKRLLLDQALKAARTDGVRSRIQDDLKRLDFLGQPIPLRGVATDGTEVDVAQFKGKIVLAYFFATWSEPSMIGLGEVAYLRKTFPESQLAVIGVNLDQSRETLEGARTTRGITWPVLWDGRGWQSPLIRNLSINALPTLWILDKNGRLRTLNATKESEALVRRLLAEK